MKTLLAPFLMFAVASPVPANKAGPLPADHPLPQPQAGIKKLLEKDRYKTTAYDASALGMAQLDAALANAKDKRLNLVVVLGANWCHDSAALANDMGKAPLLKLMSEKYQTVFIDVGKPKIPGKGRNLDVPKRFGIEKLAGTPTVLILSPDGKMLNSVEDAKSWRNAASRKPQDVLAYFTKAAKQE